jgi:ribonuclease VapC
VAQHLSRAGVPGTEIEALIAALGVAYVPPDPRDAIAAGLMYAATSRFGLSLGDRMCLAAGRRLELPVYSADLIWSELDVGVDVRLIR